MSRPPAGGKSTGQSFLAGIRLERDARPGDVADVSAGRLESRRSTSRHTRSPSPGLTRSNDHHDDDGGSSDDGHSRSPDSGPEGVHGRRTGNAWPDSHARRPRRPLPPGAALQSPPSAAAAAAAAAPAQRRQPQPRPTDTRTTARSFLSGIQFEPSRSAIPPLAASDFPGSRPHYSSDDEYTLPWSDDPAAEEEDEDEEEEEEEFFELSDDESFVSTRATNRFYKPAVRGRASLSAISPGGVYFSLRDHRRQVGSFSSLSFLSDAPTGYEPGIYSDEYSSRSRSPTPSPPGGFPRPGGGRASPDPVPDARRAPDPPPEPLPLAAPATAALVPAPVSAPAVADTTPAPDPPAIIASPPPAPSRYVYIDNLTAVLPASLSHPRGADEDAYADADAVLRFSLVAKSMSPAGSLIGGFSTIPFGASGHQSRKQKTNYIPLQKTPVQTYDYLFAPDAASDYVDRNYTPLTLDNPQLRRGRFKTVQSLPFMMFSTIPHVKSVDLVNELNEQFRLHNPGLPADVTLDLIRQTKDRMVTVGKEVDMEVLDIACAFVYLEKLILKKRVNKDTIRLVAGVCLLLAAKISDLDSRPPPFNYYYMPPEPSQPPSRPPSPNSSSSRLSLGVDRPAARDGARQGPQASAPTPAPPLPPPSPPLLPAGETVLVAPPSAAELRQLAHQHPGPEGTTTSAAADPMGLQLPGLSPGLLPPPPPPPLPPAHYFSPSSRTPAAPGLLKPGSKSMSDAAREADANEMETRRVLACEAQELAENARERSRKWLISLIDAITRHLEVSARSVRQFEFAVMCALDFNVQVPPMLSVPHFRRILTEHGSSFEPADDDDSAGGRASRMRMRRRGTGRSPKGHRAAKQDYENPGVAGAQAYLGAKMFDVFERERAAQ
ncbi:hypothetical protein H696_01935 [Fonticula alba]|uniref:Cyclin N-terminal domain-containing protein n=1 Tax=Fonticula alba TaxID=691883 RepID=A0A058Z9M7_FONAL|nr:hypothetical protein H696_01935 [Fonticula alba]KCV70989.1 hypothetical protein H696_01935 [Fonticula alba]|eukprot:XP_009494112.1 hypothetical protein H696_01935 [Fonticula alba]